jgi:pSer/pThr/pTyr-binding forkhead associated (FHA) protein
VEILQEADTVVVTDLGSTNGTTVTLAGFAPRTLRQGESLVVGAGTIVDIGDGIRILIVTLPDNAATEGTQ